MRRSLLSYFINGALRILFRAQLSRKEMNVEAARRHVARFLEPLATFASGVSLRDGQIAGVPMNWIESPDTPGRSLILYFHGGGFYLETPRTHGGFLSHLAKKSGVKAAMLNYRLAPEHPFPAAVDDCFAAYRGLLETGYDAADIVVMGDSAGGNLALVTLQKARDAGLPMPACAVFISTSTDLSGTPSQASNAGKDPIG